MTASTTETAASQDMSWRVACQRKQEVCLPDGRVAVTCSAEPGRGGLGRHVEELLEAFGRRSQEVDCLCGSTKLPTPRSAFEDRRAQLTQTALAAPARVSLAWRARSGNVVFDLRAASRLPAAEHLLAFGGQAQYQLRTAGRMGYRSVSVVSATVHLQDLIDRHERAHRQYPLERSWAALLAERHLREYRLADRIFVSSQHVAESFLRHGYPQENLVSFPLTPSARYERPRARTPSSTFDVVYVGSLSVAKGVPLLVDVMRRLPFSDLRLMLVGGPGSRGMRRYIEDAVRRDPRIKVCPGDPLSYLQTARLCVHPSFSDGFGYAPAEALAMGLAVIVSEDTGMKELIDAGRDGLILPTGDLDALTETIKGAYRGELLGD